LEELMTAMHNAKKEEMIRIRDKLMKLEMNLTFSLEKEEIEPHL
jgi:hypothetical protein